MSYPMVEYNDPFLGNTFMEMSPEDYEEEIKWYQVFIKRHENDTMSRREEEYVAYLRRWFGDGYCDGLPDFNTRYNWHTLPMSFNVYFSH